MCSLALPRCLSTLNWRSTTRFLQPASLIPYFPLVFTSPVRELILRGALPSLPHNPSQGALTLSTLPRTSKSTGSQSDNRTTESTSETIGSGRNVSDRKQERKENNTEDKSTDRAQRRL